MRKIQFGCGGNLLPGWENYDAEINIGNRLAFPDACCDYILAEHVVEHISHRLAWNFFEECHRILVPKGVVRIAVPDVARIWRCFTPVYGEAVRRDGCGDGSRASAVKAAIFEHGHKGVWTAELLQAVMSAIGFTTAVEVIGKSSHPELCDVEGHWRVVGKDAAEVETSIVEGTK